METEFSEAGHMITVWWLILFTADYQFAERYILLLFQERSIKHLH